MVAERQAEGLKSTATRMEYGIVRFPFSRNKEKVAALKFFRASS